MKKLFRIAESPRTIPARLSQLPEIPGLRRCVNMFSCCCLALDSAFQVAVCPPSNNLDERHDLAQQFTHLGLEAGMMYIPRFLLCLFCCFLQEAWTPHPSGWPLRVAPTITERAKISTRPQSVVRKIVSASPLSRTASTLLLTVPL